MTGSTTGDPPTVENDSDGDDCPTCAGEGILIGDAVDRRGERTDGIFDCPDCTEDTFRELDDEDDKLGALERWWP